MAIPMNTIDIQQAELDTASRFASEVERLGEYVFSDGFKVVDGVERLCITNYPCRPYYGDEVSEKLGFKITTEHMKALIDEFKRANYVVYAYEYHNGHYGTTEIPRYYVTRHRLGASDRALLNVQDEWSQPWGPGREQSRGYIV